MNMKPVPTIFHPKRVINKNSKISNVTLPISIPWRSPRKRLYQGDQYELFISARFQLKTWHAWMNFFPSGYTFTKNDDHVFFKSLENEISVTHCIRIDSELHVQHFFKEAWRNHYPNGFTVDAIVVCLAKVC